MSDSEYVDDDEQVMEDAPQKPYKTFDYFDAASDFGEFTLDEIKVFVEAFEEFDVDGSGSIDAKELEAAFTKMGQGSNPELIQELIEQFDEDKSGEIDWPEYLMMMRDFYPWKRMEYVMNYLVPAQKYPEFDKEDIMVFTDAFREFDVDHSGNIDAEELREAFLQMGQGCSQEEAERILEEFDEDGSGKIEFGEFLEIMRTVFYPFKRIVYEVLFYGPALKSPEFSRAEIDSMALSFKKFDKDGSNSIDMGELADLFKTMGQGVKKEDIEMLMEDFDTDGSGELEWPEFLEMMKIFYPWKRIDYEYEFYLPALKFPEFSHAEIDVFSLTFREFDLDESGSIDARELAIALKKMGQGASPEKVKKIIEEVDDNGNGEIEWVEYLQIMRNFYPGKLKEFEKKFLEPAKAFPEFDSEDILIFVEAFRDFDTDGNGTIDPQELAVAFKKMGQGASKERIAEIINEVDDNKNGVVDWPEFLQIMSNLYAARKASTTAPAKTATPVKATTPAKTTAPTPTKTVAPTPTKTVAPTPVKTVAPTPTKTASPTPVKSTTPTSPTPVKSTTTTTTPAKTTAPTPVKSTTPATSTPTKTTTTTTPAPQPTKSTFGTAKPTTASTTTTSSFASHRASNVCPVCSKTVYPIEAVQAQEQTFHKGCFKCQETGCGVSLTLSTFKGVAGKVYCSKHVPSNKPTQLTVQGSLQTANAVNAPKLAKAQGVKKNERLTFAPGQINPGDISEDQ